MKLKDRWMPDCRSYKRILIWAWLEFKEWHEDKKESSKVRDAETKWSRSTETFIWITVSNILDGDAQEMAGHTEKDCAVHGVKSALPTTSSLVHFYILHCHHVPKRAFLFQRFFKILDWTVLLKFYLYVPLAPRIPRLEANPSFPPTAHTDAIPPGFPISPMTVLSSTAPKWKFQPFLVGHPVQYNSPSKNP